MLRTFLKKNKKGFTLTELMIVVVIIGILTAIAIPIYSSVSNGAKIKACEANIRVLKGAIATYVADSDTQSRPTSLDDLKPYLDGNVVPTCPFGDTYEGADASGAKVTSNGDIYSIVAHNHS